MKYKMFVFLVYFLYMNCIGNMAKPYTEGATFSELYGSENCVVKNEKIKIDIVKEPSGFFYIAKYAINYSIVSDKNQLIPLLFIGDGLTNVNRVLINGESVSFDLINSENFKKYSFIEKYQENDQVKYYVRYQKDTPIEVIPENLFLFEANILKGENNIIVEYEGILGFNNFGFQKISDLKYSLVPSKYWKSFGVINVELNLPENAKILSSNLDDFQQENNKYTWKVDNINNDIEIKITQKTSFISSVLLSLQPIGIALIILFVMVYFHIKLIVKTKNKWIIWCGSLLVSVLFYVIYFLAYDLIDFSLGNGGSRHGYVFLYVFTFPFFLIIYLLIIYAINKSRNLNVSV